MSSILVNVFKATVGLLVDKARAKAAEKLKDGDVTDQKFRNLIVKNIDDIKTKLDGLARKDLLASVEIFKTGILSLNQVFEKMSIDEDAATATGELQGNDSQKKETDTSEQAVALSVVKQTQALQLNDLNESAKQSLSDAKQRFQEARLEAIRAFNNDALSVPDRILALNIRLMATILERVDRPADALDECMLCLENLHAMPAVRENLRVHLSGGLKKLVNKEKREAVVLAVCQANHVVLSVTKITSVDKSLPCVKLGSKSVYISRDERLVKFLIKHDMCHMYHGFWSFGQKDWSSSIFGITANTRGQFMVVYEVNDVCVYSPWGEFLHPIDVHPDRRIIAPSAGIATDHSDNLYLLVEWKQASSVSLNFARPHYVRHDLQMYNKHGKLQKTLPLGKGFKGIAVTVNNSNQILVLGFSRLSENFRVEVIDAESNRAARSFGKGILKSPRDICVAGDGFVLALDLGGSPCVHSFSPEGDHKHQFALQAVEECSLGSIAFNHTNNTIVTSLWAWDKENVGGVSVYSQDGEFVKDIPTFAGKTTIQARQIAVTVDGQIAAVTRIENKICVVES